MAILNPVPTSNRRGFPMAIKRTTALLALPLTMLLLSSCLAPHALHSLQLVNETRSSRGFAPVERHPTLTAQARASRVAFG